MQNSQIENQEPKAMRHENEVLFSEMEGNDGDLGIITLNRPSVLNSLNHRMVLAMTSELKKWMHAPQIKGVVIQASPGRAFCAGGDLRDAYERHQAHQTVSAQFFYDEYLLNRTIFHYPKPYIALLNGITMGGGVGISIHGSHRIATDHLLFAMPETGIGFFPDVGGTYFLPRLPGKIGLYLGLTGVRIGSDDCVALGIATHKVPHEKLPKLLENLAKTSFKIDPKKSVTEIIEQYKMAVKSSSHLMNDSEINQCFAEDSMTTILQALNNSTFSMCKEIGQNLLKKSPTSLKVTLEALRRGAKKTFDDCMRQEYRLTSHFLQGHDFFEGIRAVIIDKDQSPTWKPSSLQDLTENEVTAYFAPVNKELE